MPGEPKSDRALLQKCIIHSPQGRFQREPARRLDGGAVPPTTAESFCTPPWRNQTSGLALLDNTGGGSPLSRFRSDNEGWADGISGQSGVSIPIRFLFLLAMVARNPSSQRPQSIELSSGRRGRPFFVVTVFEHEGVLADR